MLLGLVDSFCDRCNRRPRWRLCKRQGVSRTRYPERLAPAFSISSSISFVEIALFVIRIRDVTLYNRCRLHIAGRVELFAFFTLNRAVLTP
jgi:hypothetical protein